MLQGTRHPGIGLYKYLECMEALKGSKLKRKRGRWGAGAGPIFSTASAVRSFFVLDSLHSHTPYPAPGSLHYIFIFRRSLAASSLVSNVTAFGLRRHRWCRSWPPAAYRSPGAVAWARPRSGHALPGGTPRGAPARPQPPPHPAHSPLLQFMAPQCAFLGRSRANQVCCIHADPERPAPDRQAHRSHRRCRVRRLWRPPARLPGAPGRHHRPFNGEHRRRRPAPPPPPSTTHLPSLLLRAPPTLRCSLPMPPPSRCVCSPRLTWPPAA